MEKVNELNINSLFDYLVFSREHDKEYKLVIIVTDKQTVLSIKKRHYDDHWNMIVDLNKMIFPRRNYDDNHISNDTFIFTSLGSDVEVDIPKKVSITQYQEVRRITYQIRQFEDYADKLIYMPLSTYEIEELSRERLTDIKRESDDEVIIGTPIKPNNSKRKIFENRW